MLTEAEKGITLCCSKAEIALLALIVHLNKFQLFVRLLQPLTDLQKKSFNQIYSAESFVTDSALPLSDFTLKIKIADN